MLPDIHKLQINGNIKTVMQQEILVKSQLTQQRFEVHAMDSSGEKSILVVGDGVN